MTMNWWYHDTKRNVNVIMLEKCEIIDVNFCFNSTTRKFVYRWLGARRLMCFPPESRLNLSLFPSAVDDALKINFVWHESVQRVSLTRIQWLSSLSLSLSIWWNLFYQESGWLLNVSQDNLNQKSREKCQSHQKNLLKSRLEYFDCQWRKNDYDF